ncbi:DNA polymerase III subunit gamma/tau C-terminal domain-containing protein, partial [Arenimonas caeni]
PPPVFAEPPRNEPPRHEPAPVAAAPVQPAAPAAPTGGGARLASAEDWLDLVADAGLRGPVRELAAHCAFCDYADGVLSLSLPDSFDHLRSDSLLRQLAAALAPHLGAEPRLRFEAARAAAGETLHDRTQRQRGERQAGAESDFLSDPVVAQLVKQGATLVPDSIRPLDDH